MQGIRMTQRATHHAGTNVQYDLKNKHTDKAAMQRVLRSQQQHVKVHQDVARKCNSKIQLKKSTQGEIVNSESDMSRNIIINKYTMARVQGRSHTT